MSQRSTGATTSLVAVRIDGSDATISRIAPKIDGAVENLGLLALLARQVRNVIVFVNVPRYPNQGDKNTDDQLIRFP